MKEIPDTSIQQVAKYINERNNKNYYIPIVGNEQNPESPQYFEIIDFGDIDASERKFYAVDGSSNGQEFYNGLYIGVYTAGYVCFHRGNQLRMNDLDNPIILGKSYFPNNILIGQQSDKFAIYDELLEMQPVRRFFEFLGDSPCIQTREGFSALSRKERAGLGSPALLPQGNLQASRHRRIAGSGMPAPCAADGRSWVRSWC